jgi:hypothetical protein
MLPCGEFSPELPVPVVEICRRVPISQSLVLTRKYGQEMPEKQMEEGNILAGPEERDIVADVRGPGSYRL